MGKRILWLAVSGLMALSLVLAACGQAATTPATPATPAAPAPATPAAPLAPAPQPAPAAQERQQVSPETPKYGGTITYRLPADPTNFDSGINRRSGVLLGNVYQQYMTSDWKRSPAGSGVTDWNAGATSMEDYYQPELAESWKITDVSTWVLTIRQGVHWQQVNSDAGRLMGGRQMTADDIVSGWNRLIQAPNSWINFSQPAVAKSVSISKTGPWEVTIKTPLDYLTAFFWLVQGGGFNRVYPPEVVAKYGDAGNWRNTVGTGPFMLVDYVPGSQLLYLRNNNYWERDPIGPGKGSQLPYVDSVRELIIPDLSTTLAALRTAKLDLQTGIVLTDARSLSKTSPQLQSLKYLSNVPYVFAMRLDKPNLPHSNVKVRQAMLLATDIEAFKRDYYGGEAETDIFPVNLNFKGAGAFAPMSQMPQSVQDLYKYNPERARQLLKEAGYPNGFKVTAIVSSAGSDVDEAAVYKAMWAKVGIDLSLDVKDVGTYTNFVTLRNNEDMIYRTIPASWPVMFYFSPIRGVSANNPSYINDPPGTDAGIESTFQAMNNDLIVNMPHFFQLFKELRPHLLEQAYVIPRPTPYTYTFWWPWLKNYYGQGIIFMRYHWIDQEIKKSMGF